MTKSISTASSGNILTWQQLLCDETPERILPAVQQHYVKKKEVRERANVFIDGCKVVTKEMHYQKMLKQLIGHVSWSKLDSPFPMCNETIEKREKKEKMVDK